MKKGKKVYTLKIWFNDTTGECTGLVEHIEEIETESTPLGSEHNVAREFISDCIPEEYVDLINVFEIGVA